MSRTMRWWDKHNPIESRRGWGWFDGETWKLDSMQVFGYKKERHIRKSIRHSIRSQNRTRLAHGIFIPLLEIKGEYFD